MASKTKNLFGPAVLILALILAGIPALAEGPPENCSRLTVTGNALISAAPDLLQVILGVETSDLSAEKAARENAVLMEKALEALRDLGLTEEEISTGGYNIYSYSQTININTPQETLVTRYRVQNKIIIRTSRLDQAGQIVDTAVKAGVNQVQGVRFDLVDKQELKLQALKNALQQAREKAEAIAESAGVALKGIISISEDYGTYAPMQDTIVLRAESLAKGGETSIMPGDIEISANVTVLFWF